MQNHNIQLFRGKIDLNDFTPVESPQKRRKVMAIGVNPSGCLSMNERFRAALKNRSVDFRISKDKKTIVINEESGGEYTFPKSGNIKDIEFVRALSASGLTVPCRYIMKYSEDQKLWVGEYTDTLFGDKCVIERELEKEMAKAKKGKKNGK